MRNSSEAEMSLVSRGQVGDDQPASPVPRIQSVQAGKTAGEFQGRFGSSRAAEMKGPQSKGQRPETTGSRGGSASGSIGRSAGGCPAAAQTVLRPVGSSARTLARASSELSRPDASHATQTAEEEAEDIRLQMSSEVPDNGVSAHGGAAACAASCQ